MRSLRSRLAALILLAAGAANADDAKKDEKTGEPQAVFLLPTIGEGAPAQELDATLRDGVQDLGMRPSGEPQSGAASRDVDLVLRANAGDGTWVVSPRIEPQDDGTFLVRILAVPPHSKEVRTRVELVKGPDVAARGLVMLRDLVRGTAPAPPPAPCPPPVVLPAPVPRSAGRAVLAVNGSVFGGFIAYSLHRVTVKDEGFGDPRVAIPLAALGAGVGLGSALLAAEEWDITPPMAWYVGAGMWWGVASGFFFASGYDVGSSGNVNDRFYVAMAGGGIGLSLATFALTQKRVDEGGMLITHSSAMLGLWVGGLIQVLGEGPTDPFAKSPSTGWGWGTAIGLVGGGLFGLLVRVPPTRVLLTDLGAVLGGLAGAAAASPLIVDNTSPDKTRGWVIATLAGAALGTGAAIWFTRSIKAAPLASSRYGSPFVGVVGSSITPRGDVPALGMGWHGSW